MRTALPLPLALLLDVVIADSWHAVASSAAARALRALSRGRRQQLQLAAIAIACNCDFSERIDIARCNCKNSRPSWSTTFKKIQRSAGPNSNFNDERNGIV